MQAAERARDFNPGCDESRQTPIWIKQSAVQPVPFALTAMPSRKNIGTATRPWNLYKFRGCPIRAPIHRWLALQAIRLDCMSGTAARHPIQISGLGPNLPTGLAGRRRKHHVKQRVTSNGLFSFRMWKHARASLCASALRATIGLVLAFLRS